MLRMSPRRHHGKEAKQYLLYFPEDRTCSVLPRSKLVDAEGKGNMLNMKPRSEVEAKWSERGHKMSLYKRIIVSSDENQTPAELKTEWTRFGKHILKNDENPVETFLKEKEMDQISSGDDQTDLEADPKPKKGEKRKENSNAKIVTVEHKKHKFDSSDQEDENEEMSDTAAKKLLKKWKGKEPKKRVKKLQPQKESDTDEDSDQETLTALHKKEKKAKRSLIREYKVEEDNKNREDSSNVLQAVEKMEPTEETRVKSHADLKDMFRSVLAEELKPITESIGTLTALYSQLNSHLMYKREKSKTPKQITLVSGKTQSPSQVDVDVGSENNTPPPKLPDRDDSQRPGISGIQLNEVNEKKQAATVAMKCEEELEYVGDSGLAVKAHKDLITKALDSSTDRKKLALNMMEVIFSSKELRESTINGSNQKKKLDGLRVAAIKGFVFKHYPPRDEADRSSSWGKIKEAITDKCRKFRPEKKTFVDDFVN